MGSCYISIPARDGKIICSACGKIISAQRAEEHVFDCAGTK